MFSETGGLVNLGQLIIKDSTLFFRTTNGSNIVVDLFSMSSSAGVSGGRRFELIVLYLLHNASLELEENTNLQQGYP